MKSVVVEHAEVITPLGFLHETTTGLIDGKQAIVPGPCFGVPVAFAPFTDTKYRDCATCASILVSHIDLSSTPPESTVFIYCAAKGDIRVYEEMLRSPASTADISPLLDRQADAVCAFLGFRPARKMVVSNACASGAVGTEIATELLKSGLFTHALLFGFDSLSRFTTTGFFALTALSDTGARPFDARRNGLTMGEGAGITLLSYRQANPGESVISGAGSSNDANHRTGPSRTGEGLFQAASAALTDASYAPDAIGGVKCHGTATPYNDAMEAKALHLIFGGHIPPCVSLKGAIGHLSGAGSLIEILIAAACIQRGTLPPTIGYETHGVDEPVPISPNPQQLEIPRILCLSAGFGGLNAAVIVEEYI